MDKDYKYLHPIFAPFEVTRREKSHFLWLVIVIFLGAIEIIYPLLHGDLQELNESIQKGILYTFAVAFCAPVFPTLFIQSYTRNRSERDNYFSNYKTWVGLITVLFLFITFFIFEGVFKSSLIWQIFSALISILLSFFMYCLGEMEFFPDLIERFDTKSYRFQEKRRMNKTREKAKQIEGRKDGIDY